jgi:hypothetical protein
MKPGVDLEGSQISSTSLSTDDLLRRVAGMVGRLDDGVLSQPSMRPDHGYVSLVTVRSSFCFALSFFYVFDSYRWDFCSSPGVEGFKLSRPLVSEDAADRAMRRLAAEKERRRTRKRPGLASGCELGKAWRSIVGGRQGMGSRWSRRRRRLTTTTMMMMMKMTTWRPDLASVRTRG